METKGKDMISLQLPAWRPGRYELANYAQNLRGFQVKDGEGNVLRYHKRTKDCWEINPGSAVECIVTYEYYANQLDAGASYFDENQLYINPVNCLPYVQEWINEPCQLQLFIQEDFSIASSLHFDTSKTATVSDYHTLADSPVIASNSLKHEIYSVGDYVFHIWMQGECRPDWNKVKMDFYSFTREQIELFTEMPVKEYHFLFHFLPQKFHHGVEHLESTVICLGPGYRLMKADLYADFIGISSHELFHVWNVKSIRPIEMMPYEYSEENYTNLGYVAEGVTTYYGDLVLLRSKVYSWDQYAIELQALLHRHFHVFGRFYQSLAESSFDTWLDGYKPGIPDRKVNMYVKGAMVAFILDIFLRRDSQGQFSLDDLMRDLYFRYAKLQKGYSEQDYLFIINQLSGKDYTGFFNRYVWGLDPIEEPFQEALGEIGCRLRLSESPLLAENRLGLRLRDDHRCIVSQTAPSSPADVAGLSLGDEILAINGLQAERNNFEDLLTYFAGQPKKLSLMRNKQYEEVVMIEDGLRYFPIYSIMKLADAGIAQKEAFWLWAKASF